MSRRWLLALVLVAIPFGLALREIRLPEYPDEDIARAVSQRIWKEGTLDTNWRHLPRIAEHYPGDQFNFSSAIVAAQPIAYAVALATGEQAWDPRPLRAASALFSALALALFFLAFARLWDPATAALALAFTVLSTQLFLDSLYARPEAFVLLCFAAALLSVLRATASARGRIAWLGAAGICCGLLAASKFSLLFVVGHIGLVHLALLREGSAIGSPRKLLAEAGALLAGLIVGFGLGAPAALADLPAFLRGATALVTQYGAPHYPYGRPGEPIGARAAYALDQIVAVHGWPQLLLAAVGAAWWMWLRPGVASAVVLPAVAFIAYFCTGQVYFERNFSFYLPLVAGLCAFTIVGIGRALKPRGVVAIAAAAATALVALTPPARMFARIALDVLPGTEARLAALARQESALSASLRLPLGPILYATNQEVPWVVWRASDKNPTIHRMWDLGDRWSRESAMTLVRDHQWRLVGEYKSVVDDLGQPLLQLAHDKGFRFLVPPGAPMHDPREIIDAWGLCALSPVPVRGEGTKPGGAHPTVVAPFEASAFWGSWAGSDEATGKVDIGPFVPPPGSRLALVTGPAVEGVRAMVRDANDGRVLAEFPAVAVRDWVAWRLPDTREPIVVEVRDDGRGWGQWIAAGTTLLREPVRGSCETR